MAAWALQFLLLEQREIALSWLLLGAILFYFNGDTNIWSSKQKQNPVQSLAEALPHPAASVQEEGHTWEPWASPQPGGGPGSTAHSKMPLETLSTNLQTVQCVSWELHPASKPLTSGQWRDQVQDLTSKLGSDQSRPTSKHIRKHHHTPHTPSLGQIWNTKIYWHHCIDPGWERIIMWTKVAISQNSPRRGEMHTGKELFILIFTADAIWEEIWSNVFVNMSWVITG